jgi:ATP-dependent Lon protease
MMKRLPRSSSTPPSAENVDLDMSSPDTPPAAPKARSKKAPATISPAAKARRPRAPRDPKAAQDEAQVVDSLLVPCLPMRGVVAFPGMILPLFIGREKSVAAIAAASEGDKAIVMVAQRDENVEEPSPGDLYGFGVLGEVTQSMRMPDGNMRVVIEARERVQVLEVPQDDPFLAVRVRAVESRVTKETPEVEALTRRLKEGLEQVVNLSKTVPPEALHNAHGMDDLGALADLVASFLESDIQIRQDVLEELEPLARAKAVAGMLSHELQVLEIDREIDSQVREGVNDSQREYFLRERLKAIQDKLSDTDSSFKDADALREKVAASGMEGEAKEKALSEIDRMEKMPPIAPEVSVIRTYVELLCDLPWNKRTPDNLDLGHAQGILDAEHFGLEKIKDRILEFLAVRKLNPSTKGPILCFMGPPGVGKTSIGKSIAHALGREFIRISVGGVHDEAEIRGHRRTYIGSMPGRVISGMKRVKVKNPVFLLDEIDKIGRDHRGDPSSALLEALDPEQNNAFSDHYLEVPFDLSEVMWIATGNMLDSIPPALRDRLEVIRFPGYTESEKKAIARGFLIPKQVKENGLSAEQLSWSEPAVERLIHDYTREAGVRNLEREVGSVCRKIAREAAALEDIGTWKPREVLADDLGKYLGPRKFHRENGQESDEIGVSQGLAWTEVGGELLPIEVSLVPGEGKVKLTGNLGTVMKESCEAAMTYARSHAQPLGIDGDWTKQHDAHIHVPAGATPKDGPSAGVAIVLALVSAMTKRAVRADIAVTGEISLRGRVLPVGGIREKVLAAHRAGIFHVLLPRENERDLEDLAPEVREAMTFHLLDKVGEAITLALRTAPDASNPVALEDTTATDETLIEEKAPEEVPPPKPARKTVKPKATSKTKKNARAA